MFWQDTKQCKSKSERPQDTALEQSPVHLGSPGVFHAKHLPSLYVEDVRMIYFEHDITKKQEGLRCFSEIH